MTDVVSHISLSVGRHSWSSPALSQDVLSVLGTANFPPIYLCVRKILLTSPYNYIRCSCYQYAIVLWDEREYPANTDTRFTTLSGRMARYTLLRGYFFVCQSWFRSMVDVVLILLNCLMMIHAYLINLKREIRFHFIALVGSKHAHNLTYIGWHIYYQLLNMTMRSMILRI
jgi:hypothetical protein